MEVDMLMRTIIVVLLAVGTAGVASAMEGDSLWSRSYSDSPRDIANSLIQCSDGNFLLAGDASVNGVALVKVAPNGDQLWFRTYAPNLYNIAYDVTEAADGGYVFAGSAWENDSLHMQVWMCKTNANGDSLWSRFFGTEEAETAHHIITTSDGGYLVTCRCSSESQVYIWIIKTDSNGDSLWSRRYDSVWAGEAIETYDGYYMVTCCHPQYDWAQIIKIDAAGNTIWTQIYPFVPALYCMTETQNHDILLANTMLMKINSAGDTLWTRSISDSLFYQAYDAIETADGGYLLTGRSIYYDFYLMKTNSEGEFLWSKTYNSGWADVAHACVQGNDGDYRIAGYRQDGYRAEMWLVCAEGSASPVQSSPVIHPASFILHPPSPNPFNPSIALSY
jgi:hypothetical protein